MSRRGDFKNGYESKSSSSSDFQVGEGADLLPPSPQKPFSKAVSFSAPSETFTPPPIPNSLSGISAITDDEETKENADCQQFLTDCGTVIDGVRHYGTLEKAGIVANLKTNQYLKKSGTEHSGAARAATDATASTREAFFVGIDKDAFGKTDHEADIEIIRSLPEREKTLFRTKDIKYGNHNAMWEIMSGQLYGLTGLNAPDTRFMVYEDFRSDGAPKVFVASPTITGYQDLGDFFVNPVIKRFINADSVEKWEKAAEAIEEINQKSRAGTITGDEKIQRVNLMSEIYELLPDYFHSEIEKSFVASKFIANWDFANFNLNNIGCKFTLDEQGNVIGFESVFVDFGNSGAIGFGGQYKELSLEKANSEAKKASATSTDFDPSLTLTEEEIEFLRKGFSEEITAELIAKLNHGTLSNEEQKKLAEALKANPNQEQLEHTINQLNKKIDEASDKDRALIKSINFKLAHHIRPEEASMKLDSGVSGPLSFSDLPRNLPFGILLKPALQEKTRKITDGQNISETYRDSEIEMAFRLSLISDEAIAHVVEKWNLAETYPGVFPVPEAFKNNPDYKQHGIIETFKQRRDALVESIPQEVVNEWISRNRSQALAAEQSVRLALLKKTGSEEFLKSENSFAARITHAKGSSDKDLLAKAIEEEIERYAATLVTDSSPLAEKYAIIAADSQRLAAMPAAIESVSGDIKTILEASQRDLSKKITNLTAETEQQKQELVIKFIENNVEKWRELLDLKSKPNCDLFDLNKLREIHCAKFPRSHKRSNEGIVDRETALRRNELIHQENTFVYQGFIENLNKLSTNLTQSLSTTIGGASATSMSQPTSREI
ncbi:MAG: hypothetical protein KA100_02310 [Rickettsiales bacterium]|nr:hypothetical protein [Rickettsiales bacterium]